MEEKIEMLVCERCGYKWYPMPRKTKEGGLPKTCANRKCRSPYWNVPRKGNK